MIFGRLKPINEIDLLKKEINLTEKMKMRIVFELGGSICNLTDEFDTTNLRKYVYDFNKKYDLRIYSETCNCDNKVRAKLNKDGTPRKHKIYIKDWAE